MDEIEDFEHVILTVFGWKNNTDREGIACEDTDRIKLAQNRDP
jgi:hypothetical protein